MPKLILLFTFYFSFFNIIHAQKLVFDHSTVNVGSTLWHQPVTAKFHYKSREREPLRIVAVDAGCGCLQSEWSKSDIKRGDEGDISITYDANLLGHFDRYINIYVAYAKDISNNASRSTLHISHFTFLVQWHKMFTQKRNITAAGLFGIHTRFPFHHNDCEPIAMQS